MARKTATAAAPSPDSAGKAAGLQEPTAEQVAQAAADAQAKADAEAKALQEAQEAKAAQDAKDQAEAAEKANQEAAAAQALKDAADAQVKSDAEAKALKDAEDAKALAEAQAKADAKAERIAKGWALPVVDEFPATLSITNATPSKAHIVGTEVEIEAGETELVTFETAKAYRRFTTHAVQIAELRGWKYGEGITAGVAHGED